MTPTLAPRAPLLSLDDALARLLEVIEPIAQSERVSTFDALGRVLAQDVQSQLDVPPQDNSAMDGYAVRLADLPQPGAILPVAQRIPAGSVAAALAPAHAARIFTGAEVPTGADAVVMQEHCEALHDEQLPPGRPQDSGSRPQDGAMAGRGAAGAGLGSVRVNLLPSPGQNIRRRGEDVCAGMVVLERGTRLRAAALGLAASVGAATLEVAPRPRVAVFSTGDELVMPGEPLKPGAIYNSNRFTLRGLLQGMGCAVTDLGIVPDRLDATREALLRASQHHDLILTSGGVSVGEEDHLRPAVNAEGHIDLWQIAIKPGKPLAFGQVRREGPGHAWFIGLPGNPVAVFVTFLLLVRPVLLKLQGASRVAPLRLPLQANFHWSGGEKRREFLRVRLNERGALELFTNQGSGVLTSAAWADGLVDNPPGTTIAPGNTVSFLPLTGLLE